MQGETGCGKSTQVPQFILEQSISRGDGGRCNIVVTQPRWVSSRWAKNCLDRECIGECIMCNERREKQHNSRHKLREVKYKLNLATTQTTEKYYDSEKQDITWQIRLYKYCLFNTLTGGLELNFDTNRWRKTALYLTWVTNNLLYLTLIMPNSLQRQI